MDNKRRNRLVQVRQQSKDFALNVRKDVSEKVQEGLKKAQVVRERELIEWKLKTQREIQRQYEQCLSELGNAHLDACEASCEENESLFNQREDFCLLAAKRGRTAMLQEHRKREREAESRLQQKKRKLQRNAMVQADLISMRDVGVNVDTLEVHDCKETIVEYGEPAVRIEAFDKLKSDKSSYKTAYVCDIFESSSDTGEKELSDGFESEFEFNQITNLLKQNCFETYKGDENAEDFLQSADHSEGKMKPATTLNAQWPRFISVLKNKVSSSKQKSSINAIKPDLVKYVDFNGKYTKNYEPDHNLVVGNEKTSKTNSRMDAEKYEQVSKNVLRQLGEIPSNAAMEKQRRNYDCLRIELGEALVQNNNKKQAAAKVLESITATHLSKLEQTRKAKMNNAIENSLKRNILAYPLDDSKTQNKAKSTEVNVCASEIQKSDTLENSPSVVTSQKREMEVERLKKLLEQIDNQKQKLLLDFEQNQNSGENWENVAKCLEKLLKEKSSLFSKPLPNDAKDEELLARERELGKREKRLEHGIRQLYECQQKTSSSPKVSAIVPPVEIIIKVHPKLGNPKIRRFIRKSFDTLAKEPGRVFRRTPSKKTEHVGTYETQKSRSPKKYRNENVKPLVEFGRKSEDSSVSTTYQSLPEKISLKPAQHVADNQTVHYKLNPDLMPYITRLLGMNMNIEKQLSITASTVTTPGSCTINTSGNNASSNASGPCFDSDRMKRLQEFISDNYSFLGEVNNTLERSKDLNNECSKQEDGIWRETLCEKKLHPKAEAVRPVSSLVSFKPKLSLVEPLSSVHLSESESKNCLLHSNHIEVSNADLKQTSSQHTHSPEKAISSLGPSSSHINNRDMADVTRHIESHMLNNFAEYTANCHKRIDKIAQMMERVRQEKQKLIENSLSSGEFGHFTEYREIETIGRSTENANDPKDSASLLVREDPPSEEINNILQKQTRPFGVSKDSGISILSRPVTSSDFRDSPDVRVHSDERENTFQPIGKDIPKPTHMRLLEDGGSINANKNIHVWTKEHDEKAQKKSQKPPLSLNRFSPHLEKPHEPHELSTIVEVETPSASKGNLLIKVEEHVDTIEPFPSFTAYERNLQPNKQHSNISFVTLDDVKDAINEISLEPFTGLQDYGINQITQESDNEASQSSASSSSVVDIMKELRKRNIMTEPFKYIDSLKRSIEDFTQFNALDLSQLQVSEPHQTQLHVNKSDSGMRMRQPNMKSLEVDAVLEPNSPRSNDTLSGIQEIEKEPKDLQKDLSNSNSSIQTRISANITKCHKSSASDRSLSFSTTGQPMNLKEFLSRELTERSRSNADQSSNESSLSSNFMRSLLNVTCRRSGSLSSDQDKLRTSTPVHHANSSVLPSTDMQLVTCASISTLKFSEGDFTDKLCDSNISG